MSTATLHRTRPAVRPMHRPDFTDLVRSEWTKLRSLRSTWWSLGTMIVVSLAFTVAATERWKKKGVRFLDTLHARLIARHGLAGEVAFLLEPDLKEGRGGLRDIHALRWAEATRPVNWRRLRLGRRSPDRHARSQDCSPAPR